MAFQRTAVAIDLGAHAIKVVEVKVTDAGVHVLKALRLERRDLVGEDGETLDKVQVAGQLRQAMAEARIPLKGVILGIGGQESMLRYTRIPPVPAWRLKVIMNYEVTEVAEKIGEPLASDFRPLQLAREADEDQTILIGLAKEKSLEELLSAFEAAGIVVEKAVPSAMAVFAAHDAFGRKSEDDAPEDDVLLLADLGADNLSLAVVLNNRLAFARTNSFGGKNFTDSLAQAMGIAAADAEKLKVARGGLDEREKGVLYDTTIPLRSTAGQLLGMLQSTLRFASTQIGTALPPLTRVTLLGGGMRLRGLRAFLEQGLEKPVETFAPAGMKLADSLAGPAAEALASGPDEFGVALGLGAARLREAGGSEQTRTLSLLPSKYVKRREFKERTVFLYAAGVLLVVLLVARLAHAISENASARSFHTQLTQMHAGLKAKKEDLDRTTLDADKKRTRLNRFLKEAELTAFQTFVLDLLSRVLRPEIKIEKIYLDLPPSEDETSTDYNLRIAGRVNNEKRRGLEWLLELQAALKGEDRIAQVEVESSRPDGAWYTFELAVTPNYVSY